ncbi:hypothetical protein L2E82_03387 [Cichorium intybus]|uniref:Uncharacterized protein n=1 Tax=Cichorium intybus TaxID=13427 RepID=A0ACB9H3G8_CICIN|nr:hypothetical protein L2E82_03387 [Cichorium intybus]
MQFKLPGSYVEMQHKQVSSASSHHTNFSDQSIEGGPVDLGEVIQRELEKEMIREKIIAEEVERFHVLEAEVRRELMLGREIMSMNGGVRFPSSFLLGLQANELKEITNLVSKFGDVMSTLSGAEQKPPSSLSLPAVVSSKEINSSSPKKHVEWTCPICDISTTCELVFLQHPAGRKHNAKVKAKTDKYSPKWRCPICDIYTTCEHGLLNHLEGKKHTAKTQG